ncbi:MAG: transcription elongation factor GreA [Campylobacterota bacterium]
MDFPITPKGLEKVTKELEYLKTKERAKMAAEIDEARSHGDLKENAEYHAAKEKQSYMETRILELGDMVGRAKVIDPSKLAHERVSFGSTVMLTDLDSDEEITYTIVGTVEADLDKGYISLNSPLAKELLGKEEGDEIKAKMPNGVKHYAVEEVTYKEIEVDTDEYED